jgi:sterol desaturase/sphingolipid hydroxylase (fatty acid hydroxylase superfamily)
MRSISVGAEAQPSEPEPARDTIRGAVLIGLGVYFALLILGGWALLRWAPDHIDLHILHHSVRINDVRHKAFDRGLDMALVFPAVLAVELALTGWANSSLRRLVQRTPSSMSDMAAFLMWQTRIMNGLIVISTFGVALLSGVWLHDKIAAVTGVSLSAASWPLALQLPLLFGVFSFFDYWNHRLDHSRYFWPLHRFHHAADDFCVATSIRTHPAMFTGVISAVMPAAVLGASPEAVIDLGIFTGLLRYVIHSRIDSNFGFIGRYLVQSPNHHRLHHVLDISQTTVGHYSLAPIWDHLFGTWRGEADQSLVIGVAEPYRQGAWIGPDLWRDYAEFWRALWQGVIRRAPARPQSVQASTPS